MPLTHFRRDLTILLFGLISSTSAALAQASITTQTRMQDTGVSGLWISANVSLAGRGARKTPSVLWRKLSFIFGIPGTIVTFFVVDEGSDRAYGIDLQRRGRP